MCVPVKYDHLVPLIAFWLSIILMGLWSLYIASRAKRTCVDPTSYRKFYRIFHSGIEIWWKGLVAHVDARDVAIVIWHQKLQCIGWIVIFFVVMGVASYLIPTCRG